MGFGMKFVMAKGMRPMLMLVLLTACLCAPSVAWGQQAKLAGLFDLHTGIEGGSGAVRGVRRTRTTFRAGAELWIDERPEDRVGVSALVEMEPRATVGADLRYMRLFGDLVLHAGAVGVVAPNWMIGTTFGGAYRIGFAKRFAVSVGPTINVYFYGGDLPKDQILWQAMLTAGLRVSL